MATRELRISFPFPFTASISQEPSSLFIHTAMPVIRNPKPIVRNTDLYSTMQRPVIPNTDPSPNKISMTGPRQQREAINPENVPIPIPSFILSIILLIIQVGRNK